MSTASTHNSQATTTSAIQPKVSPITASILHPAKFVAGQNQAMKRMCESGQT